MSIQNDTNPNTMEYDVVVIGSGLSGLTAAFRLVQLKPNINIKILEAKDRIGGRLMSIDLPASKNTIDQWDLGGQWVGNKTIQPFVNQLLSELNIQTFPQYYTGRKVLQVGNNNKITKYDSKIPDIGMISLIDTSMLLKYLDKTNTHLFGKSEANDKLLRYYDSITAETLCKKKTWTSCTMDCTKSAMRATFGSELEKLSALYLFVYSNSCGGFLRMVESNESSAQGHRIVGGAQGVCRKLLEVIGEDKIEYNEVVLSIEETFSRNGERISLVSTHSGNKYHAKYVVMSVPPHLIHGIQFQPPLSPTKYEFFSSVSPGHLIKVILTYEEAFWRTAGYSGEIVTNGGPSFTDGCLKGPLCVVFDGTTHKQSPALVGLIGGEQAIKYEMKTKEERKEAVLKSLETFFKKEKVRDFIVYCEKIWRQESFIGGCPVSTVPPGVCRLLNDNLLMSENGIHFAVSELGKSWMGFMEGAVESGERAAIEITSKL